MENFLIVNANILTFGENPKNIRNGAIYIGSGTILDFGDEETMLSKHMSVEKKIDARGKLVMPGFIDMHNHLYSSFYQNIPVNMGKVSNYSEFMDKYWWKLTDKLSPDGIYYSAVKGIINSMKAGVTTIFNLHSAADANIDTLNDIAEAFEELSMRGVLGLEISNRNGDEVAAKMFEANVKFIGAHNTNPLVSGIVGLYNANHANDKLLADIGKYCRRTGNGLMLHLAESQEDDELSIAKHKKYSIDRLNDLGLLNSKTILATTNFMDETDIDIIAKTEANVALTPSSTYYKGFELSPLKAYTDKKIPLAFGSDGIYHSIANEARFAHRIMRQEQKNFNSDNKEISDIITNSTYKIANKFVAKSVGEIKLGAAADIIIVDYIPEYEITANNLQTHLLFGILPSRVITSIINGTFVMKDYELVGIDEDELNTKYIEFAKELK